MGSLWLVRHAESLGNLDGTHADTDLSELGRMQALELRAVLAEHHFDHVLTSPLLRARRTAQLACPNIDARVVPALRELVVPKDTFLDVTGLSPDELRRLASPSKDDNVESGSAFVARVRAWLASLPAGQPTLAFTHFAVLRECLRQLGTRPLPQHIAPCSLWPLALS